MDLPFEIPFTGDSLSDDDLPESVVNTTKALRDLLDDGEYTAPYRSPTEGVGELTAPVRDVVIERESNPALGDILRVDVSLDMDREEWRDHLRHDNSMPIRDYAAPIHDAFRKAGVTVPDGTSALGVKTTRVVEPGRVEPAVISQGYIPLNGTGIATDGGMLSLVGGVVWDTLAMYGVALPPLLGMARLLTDIGEEYTVKNNLDNKTFAVGIYDDAAGTSSPASGGDAVNDTADYDWTNPNVQKRGTSITTEPTGASYSFQSESVSVNDISGDWGVQTDTDTVFDTSDSNAVADSWYAGIEFQSEDTGEGSASNHLLCTGALSQGYEFPGVTQLTINSGGVGWTID